MRARAKITAKSPDKFIQARKTTPKSKDTITQLEVIIDNQFQQIPVEEAEHEEQEQDENENDDTGKVMRNKQITMRNKCHAKDYKP